MPIRSKLRIDPLKTHLDRSTTANTITICKLLCVTIKIKYYPMFTHVKQVKIAKNRHADFWRFLEILSDLWQFFVWFYGAYCQKIRNPFFNKSSCWYKNRHIPILYRYSGLQIGVRQYKNKPYRFMTDFNKTQVNINARDMKHLSLDSAHQDESNES